MKLVRAGLTFLLLVVFATACGGAGSGSASSAGSTKLTVGYSNISGDFLPVWVAKEAGLFKSNGLDVDLVYQNGGTRAMASLLSGGTQISQMGGSEPLSAAGGGAQPVILGTLDPVYPYKLEAQPGIKAAADLKGKKIGVADIGGSDYIACQVALPRMGVDPSSVTFVPVSSHANRTAALLGASVQAGMDDPPDSVKVEQHGLHPLVDLAQLKQPAAQTVVAASRSWLDGHRATAQHYMDAIVEAIARIKRDRAFSVSTLEKYFKSQDQQAMDQAYTFFATEALPSLPYPTAQQFTETQRVLGRSNAKVSNVDAAKLLDGSLVHNAATRGLGRE